MCLNIIFGIYSFLVKRGFHSFGKSSLIKPFLNVNNKKHISIGENVTIGSFSWIGVVTEFAGVKCQSERKVRLSIGDNTSIGNNSVISANNNVSIGKNCIFSAYVFISDHIHQYDDISKNLNEQSLSEGGYVVIKDNVFLGIKASVLRNVTIGEHSIIGTNTVVTKDVPPYCVMAGNPGRVIKRYDFKKRLWVSVK